MPIHQFIHEESGEIIDHYVPASAPSIQHSRQKRGGKIYKRVYSAPLAAKDTKVDTASAEEFRKMTDKKGMTYGEMFDLSKELAKHREEKQGSDPVTEKFYRHHEKEYGEKHPEEKKRIAHDAAMEASRKFGIILE